MFTKATLSRAQAADSLSHKKNSLPAKPTKATDKELATTEKTEWALIIIKCPLLNVK